MPYRTAVPPLSVEMRVALGNVLRRLRKERKWTLQRVSSRAGCSTTHLSCLERGMHYGMSLALLYGLCGVYGIRLSNLFAMAELQLEANAAAVRVLAPAETLFTMRTN